jgi:hypothetical protein
MLICVEEKLALDRHIVDIIVYKIGTKHRSTTMFTHIFLFLFYYLITSTSGEIIDPLSMSFTIFCKLFLIILLISLILIFVEFVNAAKKLSFHPL